MNKKQKQFAFNNEHKELLVNSKFDNLNLVGDKKKSQFDLGYI